jgi:capsid portal protein
MDKEAIGWGAFEVIREASGKIARLQHLPATKLRVLIGFQGFVEIIDTSLNARSGRHTYYQPFGQKFGKYIDDPFDLSSRPKKIFKPYNPEEDGELEIGNKGLTFNLVNKLTGEPLKGKLQTNFKKAANEVLFIPNTHSSTIYYGYSDIVPSIGAVITNVHIRDYLLQFFEHNCIPRHAVIIKGAKVDDKFMELITDYFENKVKGSAHKTIILALTGFGNKNVEVEFRSLAADNKEADFLNTRKANDAQIMAAHGIPPAILGINDAASLGSGKGLSQADLYKNRVILPLQMFWASKLNKLFRLGLGCNYAKIEFDPMDIRDALQVAQTLNLLLTLGVLTINEARRQLGLDGNLKGGDVSFVRTPPQNLIKVTDIPKLKSLLEVQTSTGKAKDIAITPNLGDNQDNNLTESIIAGQMS